MRNIHVRFEYEEALEARRNLLSSHVNLLEFHEKFKTYKNLRRRELILRVKFKRALASLNTEINRLWDSLPSEVEEEVKTIKKVRRLKTETKGDRKIKDELQEIKEKLARLGRP